MEKFEILWLEVPFSSIRHKAPHIHVKYQENEAVVFIPEGTILEGSMPNSKMKLVQAWIEETASGTVMKL